jgi:hypothetical protein
LDVNGRVVFGWNDRDAATQTGRGGKSDRSSEGSVAGRPACFSYNCMWRGRIGGPGAAEAL